MLEIALVATGRIKQKNIFNDESSVAQGDSEKEEGLDHQSEDLQVTETIFLEPRPFRVRDQLAIILPSPFDTAETVAFAIAIDVRSLPDGDRVAAAMHTWAFNECMTHLTGEDILDRKSGKEKSDTEWSGFENAIQSLQSPPIQRQVLLYLAERPSHFGECAKLSCCESAGQSSLVKG